MDIPSLYSIYLAHPSISTDTRKIKPGSIFFALSGSNFDGNTFAHEALRLGASFAVVSDISLKGDQFIYVEDTLDALQSLANHHRRQFHIPVLAITGSNGKTTTKELITKVLGGKYNVHATVGNLNNHIGVPLTLLGITNDTEFVVCEMGANHPGEIALLCKIAEPTHGFITNIGKAHLEGFGSIEGVKKAKGELFDYLKEHDGFSFVNNDDPNLLDLATRLPQKVTFGFIDSTHPDVLLNYTPHVGEPGFKLSDSLSGLELRSTMFGQYNASNLLAAYVVGKHFGVDQTKIAEILAQYVPGSNRSEIIQYKGCTIVKDAYNANPSSMELAVRSFAEQYPDGWLVLGDMKEVGQESNDAHLQMINLTSTFPFGRVYLIGEGFRHSFEISGIRDSRYHTVGDILSLKNLWHWEECRGKAILLKGSRSMQLERLLES
jgi:UDP-N-acetylmuramoyl-tripeptide--D-alanyl-D-alanine ligase